jgi:hypothetical protein
MKFLNENIVRWDSLRELVKKDDFKLINCTDLNKNPKYEKRWDSVCKIKTSSIIGNFSLDYISRKGQPYEGHLSCGCIIDYIDTDDKLSIITENTIWNFQLIKEGE